MSAPGYHSMSPDRAPMSEPPWFGADCMLKVWPVLIGWWFDLTYYSDGDDIGVNGPSGWRPSKRWAEAAGHRRGRRHLRSLARRDVEPSRVRDVQAMAETVREALRHPRRAEPLQINEVIELRMPERIYDAARVALDELVLEHTRQQAIIDRLMEAGVETWHTTVNDEPALFAWLGLTWEEYGAWVEGGVPALVALSPPPVASGGEQQ